MVKTLEITWGPLGGIIQASNEQTGIRPQIKMFRNKTSKQEKQMYSDCKKQKEKNQMLTFWLKSTEAPRIKSVLDDSSVTEYNLQIQKKHCLLKEFQ